MKISKRMLAVLCTLLMLASCFALPYGAMAAEEAETPTSEYGPVVGVIQQDEVKTTVNGGDFIGRNFNDLSPTIPLSKAGGNYAIVLEIKVQQDYGFTNADWMQASLGDGNITIYPTEGDSFQPGHLITKWLPQEGRANDTWMPVMVSLNGYTGSDIKSVQFAVYNHPERYDSNLTSDDRLYGASISFRNVYVVDMSRNADGGLKEAVATFGQQGVVQTNSYTGTGAKGIVPYTDLTYSGITSDMALTDLNLEFDVMYEGEGATGSNIKNGQVRLYSGNTEHQGYNSWGNSVIVNSGQWYHFSFPLSGFTGGTALTDATAITRAYAFNYNDGNVDFTAKAKNVKITYAPVTKVLDALEEAKTFVYDVDENATAYEEALADCRALFTSETATYADAITALEALNTAKANVTNGRDLVYEVARYSAQEYSRNDTLNANNDQIYYDWRSWDGFTNTGVDLRDDLNGDITKIGGNRYFQTTVTFTPNPNWTGDPLETLDILNRLEVRVRTNDGSEKRTNSYTLQTINKTVTADKAVYEMEILLDDSQRYQAEWDDIRQSIIFPYINVKSDANKVSPVICTLSNVRIINRTAEAIEADLEEAAAGYITPGKYTAESTAEYLTYKEQAQAMLEDDGATLQEKTQLIAKIDAAKAKFVSIVPEYVQFGEPEAITAWTNTGINGAHSQSKDFALTKNMLGDITDLSNLQLRMDVFVTRDDGAVDISATLVNGNITFKGGSAESQYGYNSAPPLKNMKAGVWNSVYIDLSSFNGLTADIVNSSTKLSLFGFNDLRNSTSNPGIAVQVKNVAIVDPTNVSAVEGLKNLFVDVTKDGTVDFTTDSYAAYKAVYDEWYEKAYATVDLTQYEAAKADLDAAYANLVCVDKTVMTFGDNFNKGWDSNASGFYANWSGATQGMVDTSIRNQDNLVIRFDISVTAKEGYTLPETLTTSNMRLAVRKWTSGNSDSEDVKSGCTCNGDKGSEHSFEFSNKSIIPSLDPTKVNTIEVPFTAKTGTNNTDGMLRDIILWMNFSELSEAAGQYVFTISNARVEDVTKDNMAADLRADAEITLDDMGQEAGCVYNTATADDFKAAQAAALEVLAKEDPTYAELETAQAAIDAGKAKLVAVGHIVMEFPTFNKTVTGTLSTVVNGWTGPQDPVDLSQYDQSKLRLRVTITLEAPEGYSMRSCYLRLRCSVDGQEWGRQYAAEKRIDAGKDNAWVVDLPFDTTDTWKKENPIMPSDKVHEIYFIGYCKDANGSTSAKEDLKIHFDNACIVDTTAEENLGSVETVGNGRVDITGGMLYGADDTLTAEAGTTSTFVGWKKNDTFQKVNGVDDTLNLPVNGKQDVTAYFAEADEAVVVYTGKYNRVVDVQVVKDTADLVAPEAPAITGQTFAGWDEVGQLVMGEANIVKAIYTTDEVTKENGYTVTLSGTTNDDATVGKFYGFDQSIKVTANVPDGQQFSHWTVNGSVAGYTDTLTFYVSGNMSVAAIYVAEDAVVEQELSASITQNQMVANNSAYNFEIIAQTYLPEGYDLMAYGVIFAPKAETLTELKNTGATEGATLDVVSSSNIPNRQYKITLEKVTAGRTRSAMAYITARDADGNVVTVYSDAVTKVAE